MRGINFKTYYNLLLNLENNETEGMTKSEYKKAIIKLLVNDLEKNWIGYHIYDDDVELDTRNHFGKFKIEYYTAGLKDCKNLIYIVFLHDCISINGLYIKYQ